MSYDYCYNDVSLRFEYNNNVWCEIDDHTMPLPLGNVTRFRIETGSDELDNLLEPIIAHHIKTRKKDMQRSLCDLYDMLEGMTKEEIMQTLAYHYEYNIDTVDDFMTCNTYSIIIVTGYDSPEEYLAEITEESCPGVNSNLFYYVDWSRYAESICFDYHSLELDGETFLYCLT